MGSTSVSELEKLLPLNADYLKLGTDDFEGVPLGLLSLRIIQSMLAGSNPLVGLRKPAYFLGIGMYPPKQLDTGRKSGVK